jgi:hypothetical protein
MLLLGGGGSLLSDQVEVSVGTCICKLPEEGVYVELRLIQMPEICVLLPYLTGSR